MDEDPGRDGTAGDFLDALADGNMDRIVRFLTCPNCESGYPTFRVPPGSIYTLCDFCGWSSEEEAERQRERWRER